jgi:nitrogenase molybdenum-iron protein alpha chain
MGSALSTTEVEIRDRRLKSILSFQGKASELQEYSKQLKKPDKARCFTQCSDCAQMCAATVCQNVRGAACVSHAPIGCFATTPGIDEGIKACAENRGVAPFHSQVICSNIGEKDTIYGGLNKLREAVLEANRRFSPSAIFIQSSCAAGIVGDDIESLADEMNDELGIPIVPVFCEGFKSKFWSSGFDAAYHGLLRKVVQAPAKKQPDLVNIFNFLGSDSFTPILAKLGLRPNYLVPMADVETIRTMTEAACSTHICETLGTYITDVLEKEYDVPKVHAPAPYGIAWTDAWYRELARLTGKTDIVEDMIASEHERIKDELAELKEQLAGKKVYIYAGDSYAHNIASLMHDLGIEICGMTTLHHDMRTDGEDADHSTLQEMIDVVGDVENFTVCNKQPYELVKLIKKANPDFMIVRHMNMTITGGKMGIPSISEGEINISAGYDGILIMGKRILELLKARKILGTLAEYSEFPYTDWWLEQEEDYF